MAEDQPTQAADERRRLRERFRVWRGGAGLAMEPSANGRPDPDGSALQLAQERRPAVTAEQVAVERSLVGRVRGGLVELHQSAAGLALGRDLRVHQGAGTVLAGARLSAEQSAAQWIVAGLVQARQVFAIAVIAGKVEGQVRCLFDARGAFAFGAGVALMSGVLRLVARRK